MTDERTQVGRIIGTKEARPLEFWVGVDESEYVQLDEVVAVTTKLPRPLADGRDEVVHYGVVDMVESAYEGASFHSDVFRDADGTLPVAVSTIAHVSVTRVGMMPAEPDTEVLVPPRPGQAVRHAEGNERDFALYFDKMDRRFPAGLSRDGQPVYGNLEFLDGSRGAHVNISGISGVATKTTYALFLLYGMFHSDSLRNAHNAHAIVFNVKGEDLLFLDKPNGKLPPDEHRKYAALGLPVGPFADVGLWAPAEKGDVVLPDTGSRSEGVTPYYWTLREFCRDRMLRFLFADADDETSQLSFVVTQVERFLEAQMEHQAPDRGEVAIDVGAGAPFNADSLHVLVDIICDNIDAIAPRAAEGTRQAFARRFEAAVTAVAPLIRTVRDADAKTNRFDWTRHQVNVIDINRLNDRAKRFVVGVVVRRLMQDKEQSPSREPLVFLVLDELNKYAPREGRSPIKEVVLDIAERGRSLGVVLIGAEQTASEIERR
ncbi:MAG TPA: ATP-binding protein, partial [Dehalococcoidia bacterium]|nr:ATP-binding protein [Dehalococcoidia bacterium]